MSYADTNWNHHGYIYQALGWLYTGGTNPERAYIDREGKLHRPRHIHIKAGLEREDTAELEKAGFHRIMQKPKHRYLKFLGDRREVRRMRKALVYSVLSYPKGDNNEYEISYRPRTRERFF